MKIVKVSNFNDEMINDQLVCSNIKNKFEADTMLEALNQKHSGDTANYHYKIVEDDYKLYTWEP